MRLHQRTGVIFLFFLLAINSVHFLAQKSMVWFFRERPPPPETTLDPSSPLPLSRSLLFNCLPFTAASSISPFFLVGNFVLVFLTTCLPFNLLDQGSFQTLLLHLSCFAVKEHYVPTWNEWLHFIEVFLKTNVPVWRVSAGSFLRIQPI